MINLSVIIPVYNGESYVTRCLTSIFSQTNFDFTFEVIAVNDGSKDNSLALLNSIKESYRNLYIFDQNNGGAGSARNIGINNAKGNFIWFIDADDYIQPNAFSVIQQFILKDDFCAATLGFNYYNVTSAGVLQPDKDSDHKDVEIFNGLEYVKQSSKKPYFLWVLIYNKKFIDIHNLRFIEGIKNLEDLEFSLRYFSTCANIVYVNKRLYNYFENTSSTSRNSSLDNLNKLACDSHVVHRSLYKIVCHNKQTNDEICEVLNRSIVGFFYSLYKFNYSFSDLKSYYNKYKSEKLLPTKIINKNLKFAIFEFIVNAKYIYLAASFIKKRIEFSLNDIFNTQ